MAFNPAKTIVRSAGSLEEASELWWPLMKELEWNRSPNDALSHFKVLRDGKDWHIIIPSSSGKQEGFVLGFTYPNKTGWVGAFVMTAAYRGQGLGRELWKGMETSFRESQTEIIGLDAVEEQVKTYQRRGFVGVGRIPLMSRPSLKKKPLENLKQSQELEKNRVKDIKEVDSGMLAKMDLEHTGLDRSAYFSKNGIHLRDDAFGVALTDASGGLRGFVLVRGCEHGQRFGPLYAETYDEAKIVLYMAMLKCHESDGSMIAEIFGSNDQGKKVFEELGWEFAGIEYHRMWLNGKATKEQQEGGKGVKGMYATFDAAAG